MALTIVSTPGATNANSFGSMEEADAYFEARLHAEAWIDDADPTQRMAALIWAARLITTTVRFNGERTFVGQSLVFPRTGLEDESGYPIDDETVPDVVKYVQFELALLLLTTDRMKESDAAAAGLTSLKAGPVALAFKSEITIKAVPDAILAMFPMEWLTSSDVPWPVVVF